MKEKINPDNDGYDPSEEYFKNKGGEYENETEYVNNEYEYLNLTTSDVHADHEYQLFFLLHQCTHSV